MRTFGIELEDVEVAFCVRDDHVELFAIGQEIGGHDFDVVRGFPEQAELVGFLLFVQIVSVHVFLSLSLREMAMKMYHISRKPNPLHRIPHQAHPRSRQLLRHANKTLHIHERHRQQRPILLQSPDHTFLALRHEQEALRADTRNGGHGSFHFFFGNEFECAAGFRMRGFGHDGDYGEDVDVPGGGEVFTADEGGAYYD